MLTAGTLVGCALAGRLARDVSARVDWSLRGPAFYESFVAGLPTARPALRGRQPRAGSRRGARGVRAAAGGPDASQAAGREA